jgi:hypothetical protein
LQEQLRDLKQDITRLTIEKDNIGRHTISDEIIDEEDLCAPRPVWVQSSRLFTGSSAREREYEAVAKRAREKLVEQQSTIDSLEQELSKVKCGSHRSEERLESRNLESLQDPFADSLVGVDRLQVSALTS